jgi:regulator of sirC expression with transglutaminase-like and TPR domain
MQKRRLKALIELLDDPDQIVFESVEKELLKENYRIIPELEQKWENSYDDFCQDRIENIIRHLQFKQTVKNLRRWVMSKDNDLLEGFICVDSFQYPDVNITNIHKKIERIQKAVWLELSNSLTMLEKTTVLNHFLFNVYGFSVNHQNINSPQNCYLNQLLDTKKGNQVSIAILYTLLARMLDLPARFTDFPNNPLIALADRKIAKQVHGGYSHSDVLFYINPSNKGSITNRSEINYHLKKNHYTPVDNYTEPTSDKIFIKRLVESLRASYVAVGYPEKKARTEELLKLFGKE